MKKILFDRFPVSHFTNGVKVADIIDYLNKTADKLNALCREIYKNEEAKNDAE